MVGVAALYFLWPEKRAETNINKTAEIYIDKPVFTKGTEMKIKPSEPLELADGVRITIDETQSMNNIDGNPHLLYSDNEIPLLRITEIKIGENIYYISLPYNCQMEYYAVSSDAFNSKYTECLIMVYKKLWAGETNNEYANLGGDLDLYVNEESASTTPQTLFTSKDGSFLSVRGIIRIEQMETFKISVVNNYGGKYITLNSKKIGEPQTVKIGPTSVTLKINSASGFNDIFKDDLVNLSISASLSNEASDDIKIIDYRQFSAFPSNQSYWAPDMKNRLPLDPEVFGYNEEIVLCKDVAETGESDFTYAYCRGDYCQAETKEECDSIDVIKGYNVRLPGSDGISDCHWAYFSDGVLSCKPTLRKITE